MTWIQGEHNPIGEVKSSSCRLTFEVAPGSCRLVLGRKSQMSERRLWGWGWWRRHKSQGLICHLALWLSPSSAPSKQKSLQTWAGITRWKCRLRAHMGETGSCIKLSEGPEKSLVHTPVWPSCLPFMTRDKPAFDCCMNNKTVRKETEWSYNENYSKTCIGHKMLNTNVFVHNNERHALLFVCMYACLFLFQMASETQIHFLQTNIAKVWFQFAPQHSYQL